MDLSLLNQCLWRRPYLVYQGCTTTYPMTVEEVKSCVSGMYHYLTNDCGGGHILYIRNALTHKQCLRRRSYLVYQGCTNTYSVVEFKSSVSRMYQYQCKNTYCRVIVKAASNFSTILIFVFIVFIKVNRTMTLTNIKMNK
jgi:hypothetical protein